MKKLSVVIMAAACITAFHIREAKAWVTYATSIPGSSSFVGDTLLKYQRQAKLVKGFANASAYSAHVATVRGYQGYDKFCITAGTMAAAQVPATSLDLGYYKKLGDRLTKEGDIYVGVAWNAWSLNVGVKLPADFYISAKFGKLTYSYWDFDFDGMNAGGMINYQLVKQKAPPVKFILWRGLSIGTGFIWQYNNTLYHYRSIPTASGIFAMKPVLKIYAKSESYVIPLELSTAIRLLWVINIHVGGGIDFAWGSSRLNYSSYGAITDGSMVGLYTVYGRQGGTGPTKFLPKVFCGPGFSFGPVIIDIPFTYYFNNGFNLGVTLGVVW
ncbi:MAG: hypothetical protein JW807_02000 [Spirochaetes bacterium]|nr:hypothetical protein [Spirochaetota bacterium]